MKANLVLLGIVVTIWGVQYANAGILNYHRNFALACAEPSYAPAMTVRVNSVALADAIRDMTSGVLDMTRAEEHWSLETLQGKETEADSQAYNMLQAASKALASSAEITNRLNGVTIAQKQILADATAQKLPGIGMQVFQAMTQSTPALASDDFSSEVDNQLSEYAKKVMAVKHSLEKTVNLLSERYGSRKPILSPEHAEISNQIRESTKLTIELLSFAEKISERTVMEVRATASKLNISACGQPIKP
ncbi:hypothetical protein [Aeromonas hydrophila]|uniref:hypothetical protein n=1 Tax=Aeromonas hydrophila TaxID=644 RepID=UPI00191DAAE0|nr:hypothetical protein [Aeromonas hydrophila]MBL0572185.1 hypothetical protein [Aeromonas hydrophila]